ncbi:uncharacterized protein KQ657_002628 [Scheffersomyces spartinae]|uniref:NADH dehydrogenase [ubiquinone] 1 beta subcomplex subunit 7 n=1 Tax=Scheffersomyces spartinae TaxID=45513 RepID=A0A9P7V6W6_9ASCO|nr:uncharacterized protein KQ657_002628 [Scheffersomyces spartinae]KAG7192020.1 hypothetical protein KQ657_002628 [Scheffersomyces spartinae]
MTAHESSAPYEFLSILCPSTNQAQSTATEQELNDNDVPFINRDKCAQRYIDYYKCLDKGTSFCSETKSKFYECQYNLLKERLDAFHKGA